MNLPEAAVKNKALVYFVEVIVLVAGIASYYSLGKLEDPDISIKTATITTEYAGASPEEVELEVTDRVEKAIQELPQVFRVYSMSREGLSIVKVDIQERYWSDSLPQVWDELRNKVADAAPTLPPGAKEPVVADDFGFVFGFLLAVTGDGFSYRELEDHADYLKKELSLAPGVVRVDLWGNQEKAIYIDVAEKQLTELGLGAENFKATLGEQNAVVDAGHLDFVERRLRVAPTGEFSDPREIGDLLLAGSGGSATGAPQSGGGQAGDTRAATAELLRVRDLGTVRRGYVDPPRWIMRHNGQPAIAIAIANEAGGNIMKTGEELDERLRQLQALLPVGIDTHKISWQSELVDAGIHEFLKALQEAVVIVIAVVAVAVGWRLALVVGSGLILSVLGMFVFMAVAGIDLHRMSLGALVVALGMIVDDIIVVADIYLLKLESGMDRVHAAIESASQNAKPLFWGTTAAAFAFFPIFLSVEGAGEFCRTLFVIVGTSLWLSWLFAMTLTPVRCINFMPNPPKKKAEAGEAKLGKLGSTFHTFLVWSIAHRYAVLGVSVAALAISLAGFGRIQQMFFPNATRAQLMIDYWGMEGTHIQTTSENLKPIEEHLRGLEYVTDVSTFIGQGPPRFYLPVDSEQPYPSYAQLVVSTRTPEDVDPLVAELRPWLEDNVADGLVRLRRYQVGPSDTWKFALRFIGPAQADLGTLRAIGEEAMGILEASPLATDVRLDMRQRVKKVVPEYSQERGRLAGVSRPEIGQATKRAQDGVEVGLYREGDDLYPILLRHMESEREPRLTGLQITPGAGPGPIPIRQVIDDVAPEWEDPIIVRMDRRRQVGVLATPVDGVTFPMLRSAVVDQLNTIKLPPGYQVFWDGEYDSSARAQASLLPGLIPAGLIMVTILVYLFNAYRPPFVIIATLPLALIGVTAGLLFFDLPFGFVAILGVLALSGIMIRNSVVLLETIDRDIEEGMSRYEAVLAAAISRARPVLTAALCAGLGLVPLFQDIFWAAMAAAMLSGLIVGTLLTLVVAPVLYAAVYGLRAPEQGANA
jgi:multidrug efflux pump subunit AcrB